MLKVFCYSEKRPDKAPLKMNRAISNRAEKIEPSSKAVSLRSVVSPNQTLFFGRKSRNISHSIKHAFFRLDTLVSLLLRPFSHDYKKSDKENRARLFSSVH